MIKVISALTELSGVGEKGATQLVAHFGTEEAAVKAIQNFQLHDLLASDLTQQTKIEIIKDIFARKYEYTYKDMFATTETKEIYTKMISIMRQFCATTYARYMLSLYQPVNEMKEITRRHEIVDRALTTTQKLPWDVIKDIKSCLKAVESVGEGHRLKANETCIATEDEEIYKELKDRLPRTVRVLLIHGENDLHDLSHYANARYIDCDNSKFSSTIDIMETVEYVSDTVPLEKAVPELTLDYYIQNKDLILSCMKIITALDTHDISVITKEEFESLNELVSELAHVSVTGYGVTTDSSTYEVTRDVLTKEIQTHVDTINARIEAQMNSLSLSGSELMHALSGSGSFPEALRNLISASVKKECNLLAMETSLSESQLYDIFETDMLPIKYDEEARDALVKSVASDSASEQFRTEKKFAERFASLIPFCEELRQKMLDLDVELSLGSFTRYLQLSKPSITQQQGYGVHNSRNLFLSREHSPAAVTPINYHLGSDKKISVITGANSGGKTTLLELIAQTHILTAMGLYVPCESAEVALQDEIYYFGKNRGDKTAGAFETLLHQFSSIKKGDGKKRMVLADEIEAVTEPGAAAKIIVSLLEYFETDKNMLMSLVTHLGNDIASQTNDSVRIDGIEAKGLDEDLNLIVDRNPKIGYLATSTPELIVERLAKRSESNLFNHIHKSMSK